MLLSIEVAHCLDLDPVRCSLRLGHWSLRHGVSCLIMIENFLRVLTHASDPLRNASALVELILPLSVDRAVAGASFDLGERLRVYHRKHLRETLANLKLLRKTEVLL